MAYTKFHQRHPDFENERPIFRDTDGSPVYGGPYRGLLHSIIHRNDVSALHLYNESPHCAVFLQTYDVDSDNPFSIALGCRSHDTLRALIKIYLSDTSLTEPLENYLNRFSVFLIHEACAAADRDLVLWLINHDPPLGTLHDRSFRDRTPLFCAAEALGEVGGLMVSGETGQGVVARQKARERRDHIEDFIYWMFSMGCSVSESDTLERSYSYQELQGAPEKWPALKRTVLGAAIPYASYEMVSFLIANGADVHGRQIWFSQCCGLDYGEEVTPLHIAALFWNLEAMQALMDHRGDAKLSDMVSVDDNEGRLPLHWALTGIIDRREESDNTDEIISRMTDTVKTLLDLKPDTVNTRDQHGATAFHFAVHMHFGHVAIPQAITLLLAANPSQDTLNSRNGRNSTALGDAIRPFTFLGGSLDQLADLVKSFITNGADAHSCDNKSRSILHILCSRAWPQSIPPAFLEFLLETIDINRIDADGCTALHYLVKNLDQGDAIRHLVSRGADVSAIDNKGNTSLHEVMKGQMLRKLYENAGVEPLPTGFPNRARDELIQVLLDAGASMDRTNDAGQAPGQILDCVLEEREKLRREDEARRARRGRIEQGRGRVFAYVDSGY
jgi:ankyrin repeat protein